MSIRYFPGTWSPAFAGGKFTAAQAGGKIAAGEQIGIRIDQTLTQDVTGTTAFLLFESMGVAKVKTQLSVSYIDHNIADFGPENHNDHLYLQTVAAKLGVHHSRAGNGICHQVHLERFAKPGATLLGSDTTSAPAGGTDINWLDTKLVRR